MNYHVIAAEYVSGYVIRLRFRDGTAGEIDLSAEPTGTVFEPLRNIEAFKQFQVHPDFHTLVWPNGADFDPATLHDWPVYESAFRELARRWEAVEA